MRTKLSTLTDIKTGVFAKPLRDGEVIYMQARHFNEQGDLVADLIPDLKLNYSVQRHLLQDGDILFAAKGWKNFASVYRSGIPAVASTTFFVLRPIVQNIIPEFLVWLLNEPKTKERLQGTAKGSAIASISKKALGELDVSVPTIERQRQILEVLRLTKTESDIRQRIAKLRQHIVHEAIVKSMR